MENIDAELYELLYYYKDDFDGEEGHDLYQVQLTENIDPERVKKLIPVLNYENRYIAYQAMLILVAWGVEEGFDTLDQFISERWDQLETFEPHRIWGADNVYDVIAEAVYTAKMNGIHSDLIWKYFSIFLQLYGQMFFEGNLKHYLLQNDDLAVDLLSNIKDALDAALKSKWYYQASQLLPVIAKYNKQDTIIYIEIFKALLSHDQRIQYNLEEAKTLL